MSFDDYQFSVYNKKLTIHGYHDDAVFSRNGLEVAIIYVKKARHAFATDRDYKYLLKRLVEGLEFLDKAILEGGWKV